MGLGLYERERDLPKQEMELGLGERERKGERATCMEGKFGWVLTREKERESESKGGCRLS